MNKLLQWVQNIIRQSNGVDDLSRFLLKGGAAIGLLGILFNNRFVLWLGFAFIIVLYLRIFSKDRNKFIQENQTFLKHKQLVLSFFQKNKNKRAQRKTHRFYKCPNCKQSVRIPKGRGKVSITCPACATKFVKKS